MQGFSQSHSQSPDPDSSREPEGWSYPRAALLMIAALLAFFGPALVRGLVLYPHDNAAEVGLRAEALDQVSRVYTDQTQLYVPEIQAHFGDRHSGWLAAWNPHNELGRPLFPSGLSPAYILSHLFYHLTPDALSFYTWTSLAAICASALFAFLFLRAIRLHPLACLTGALGISIGPIFGGSQIVPLVQWGFCWAFAALYACEVWLRRPTPWA